MKKIFWLLLIGFRIVFAETEWQIEYKTDKMTGEKSAYRISPDAYPDPKMSFPYRNVYSNLIIACDKKDEYAYFYFSISLNLLNTDIRNGYNEIKTRAKIDNKIDTITLLQEWGSNSLHIFYKKTWIKRIKNGKILLLELDWYSNGATYFSYDLSGVGKAISEIRNFCKKE